MKHSIAFTKSLLHYIKPEGTCVEERSLPYHEWVESRRDTDIWSYSRVLMTKVAHRCTLSNEYGKGNAKCLNFGSQDYLGLAQSEALRTAAREAIDEFGVHSAGSPVLSGRTRLLLELEERLRRILGREECIVFPTGWAAGFSSIAGLARPDDVVLPRYAIA